MASTELLASKIVILEEAPRIPAIAPQPTAVTGVVGICERGPIGVPTLVTSQEEYTEIFGGYTLNSGPAIAAQGFFQNGGSFLWVVRTCHYTDILDPDAFTATKGERMLQTVGGADSPAQVTSTLAETYQLAHNDTLDISVDGGGPATAQFQATAAQAICNGPFPIAPLPAGVNMTLTIGGVAHVVNSGIGGQTTALDISDLINQQITGAYAFALGAQVYIMTDKKGTGQSITVAAGAPDMAALIALPTGTTSGGGNVADIDAVTGAEVKTRVEAAVAGTAVTVNGNGTITIATVAVGPTHDIQVQASSTADTKIGLDNLLHTGGTATPQDTLKVEGKTEGSYTDNITILIADATNGEADSFNLSVIVSGVVTEVYPNITMDSTSASYAETVINHASLGSNLISVEDQSATGTLEERKPANGTSAALAGGGDGLAGIVDIDFLGSEAAKNGMYALDLVQQLGLLIIPGKTGNSIANGMLDYCEGHRNGGTFAILDPPPLATVPTAQDMVTYVELTTAILGKSEFGAIYWPQILITNPSTTVFGDGETIPVPPSGHIAGVYARNDARIGGVYENPAGVEQNAGTVLGCVGFETDEVLDERKRDLIYPKRINPITQLPGTPRHIDGSRTLKSTGNFPYIGERRGVIFIEQSLKNGLVWVKHRPNNRVLRQRVRRSVTAFLLRQLDVGAFRSTVPSEAFRVDVSDALNPPAVEFAGQLKIRIGLATNKPAEFVILLVTQDTRAFEESLAA